MHICLGLCFNPRPRAGGDFNRELVASAFRDVSIHAPARGATCTPRPPGRPMLRFQSTPPARGATPGQEVWPADNGEFQSTPPRGGATWEDFLESHGVTGFNPRPRAGGDAPDGVTVRS